MEIYAFAISTDLGEEKVNTLVAKLSQQWTDWADEFFRGQMKNRKAHHQQMHFQ